MTELDAIRDEVLRRADIAAHAARAGFRYYPRWRASAPVPGGGGTGAV
jgi:predicted N-acyltransferase